MRWLALALALAAAPAAAQDALSVSPPARGDAPEAPSIAEEAATSAPGGTLRVLDKLDGTVTDLDLQRGETATVGNISVTMGECRYPTANPAGDAFALISIRTVEDDTAVFEGWMIASAPALNALDHPRYDVWALRCDGT